MEALAKVQAEARALRMENAKLKHENEALTLNVTRLRMQLADHVPQVSFNFAGAKASAASAGSGGATGGAFGFNSANSAGSSTAIALAPGACSSSLEEVASSGAAPQAAAPPTFDGEKFNFKPLGGVVATPAPASTTIGGGTFGFKLPGTGDEDDPKQHA